MISIPLDLAYMTLAMLIDNQETLTLIVVAIWIGVPGLISFLYTWRRDDKCNELCKWVLTGLVYPSKLKMLVYCDKQEEGACMKDFELGAVQERFANIVWDNEPIGSRELARICERKLNWKRPTTYTVLRKLCEKGLFQNKDGIVSSLVERKEFYSAKSEQIIEESFKGSLPAFVAAFISRKNLSAEEADEIQKMIDSFKQGK